MNEKKQIRKRGTEWTKEVTGDTGRRMLREKDTVRRWSEYFGKLMIGKLRSDSDLHGHERGWWKHEQAGN